MNIYMKKIISVVVAVAVIATALVGCGEETTTTANIPISTYSTDEKETKLVGDPNLTGELTIQKYTFFENTNSDTLLNGYVDKFKELYSNVTVNLELVTSSDMEYESYQTKLNSDLMAGKGPDIFWTDGDVSDPYKLMKNEAMADIVPLIEKDNNLNINDFNKSVIYASQFEGKQYVIPLNYMVPMLLTTQEIIDATGFNIDKCNDYFGCINEVTKVINENKLSLEKNKIMNCYIPNSYPTFSGYGWLDYSKNIANIDNVNSKKAYKIIHDVYDEMSWKFEIDDNPYNSLINKETYFVDTTQIRYHEIMNTVRAIKQLGQTPVLIPWKNENGDLSCFAWDNIAINKNTKSLDLSYNFVKVAMCRDYFTSEEMESNMDWNPINNNLFYDSMEERREPTQLYTGEFVEMSELTDEMIDEYITIVNSVTKAEIIPPAYYMLEKEMLPYLKDEKSYEECIQSAQSKLEIYISE